MPLVNSSIPNLVNGVSQQPPTLRLASQGELQENGLSTAAQGLKKRPPTKHIKRLGDPLSGSAYIHTINRDENERYEVIITNGDLRVFDMDGEEKTVNFPDGKGYLTATDPATTFRAMTVADYTFIVNKKVTVTKSSTLTPSRPYEGLVVVRNGLYAKTYKIFIDGVEKASYTTPDGDVAAEAADISTDHIASALSSQLTSNSITHVLIGSVIRVYNDTTDFTLRTEDGYSNAALIALKGEAQRFSDLPAACGHDGFTIKVVGDANSNSDDYWVKFDMSEGAGVWRETVQPGISDGFVPSTMPWGLIREANGEFTFKILDWADRKVGDEDSSPDPTFVGKTIRDIFFYRNRLGFLADEAVVMSEAGKFFNFYPTTVTTLLDSDPIDVSASHTKVSILNFAVPFNKALLLFSSQTQFSLESGDLLTPRTVSIKPTTEFECSLLAAPVGVGRNVYFMVPRGDYEGVREYYITNDSNTEDAADVTGHVPKYIPKGVFKIAAALNEDLLCLLTRAEPNVIYVYKFFWNNYEKLQSSWSRWVFPETDHILHAEFIQSELFLVINRDDGVYLEKLSVAPGDVVEGEPYPVHLDRKHLLEAATHTYTNGRTFLDGLSWTPDDGEYVAVVPEGQPEKPGVVLQVHLDSMDAPYVNGDYSDCDLIVGRKYTFRYKFSPLMIRTRDGNSQMADTVGRLQIRRMMVNFADTGYFQAKVTPYGRNTYTYTFTGKTIGVDSATLGAVGIETGQFPFKVETQNITADIELVSDSPMPCSFLSADWEGYYVRRSQAV